MSPIVGIFHPDSHPADTNYLSRMATRLAVMEGESWKTWCVGPAGLAQFSGSTTPGADIKQVFAGDSQSGVYLAADLRIDNRQELLSALGKNGSMQPPLDDENLLLQAYLKWGEACADRLAGDFAFAVWDQRNRRMFCARDPMGVKPFYYYHARGLFAFASGLAPLFALPQVPRRLNETRIADYLVQNFEDKQITFYQQIFRLPPGHTLAVDARGMALNQYWRLDPKAEVRLGSEGEYAEAFFELFDKAVGSRLEGNLPTGAMLSGGLDSSSISCVARNHLSAQDRLPLHTFSAIFPSVKHLDARIDESRFMRAVIETGGFEAHFVPADSARPLADWMWQGDEPVPAPNIYMDLAIFNAAREAGMQVILSGFDGDSTVSYGFEQMASYLLQGKWPRFISETISLARRFEVNRRRIVWRLGVKPLIPQQALRLANRLRGKGESFVDQPGAIDASFARRLGLEDRIDGFSLDGSSLELSPREQHRRAITSGLLEYALSQLHSAGGISTVEPRYPFFDRRLIEFSLALPAEQKLNKGWTRYVLRNAMAGILPDEVRWRSGKSNLSINFKQRLKEDLGGMDERAFIISHGNLEGFVDQDRLRQAYRRFQAKPVAAEKDALTLFLTVVLSRWLKTSGLAN